MDKLLLHVIKLEKILDLKEGIKNVKYIGYDDALTDFISEAQIFDKDVEHELPILLLKYATWDILIIYKYILSNDFTVFTTHYPYAIRPELRRLNLLKKNEIKVTNNVEEKTNAHIETKRTE